MMLLSAALAAMLAGAMAPPNTQDDTRPATGFLYKTITVGNETYAYSVYVPPEYTPETAWPVILFLHGSGERGRDGLLQTSVGLPRTIRKNRALVPAVVVMPQCRDDRVWTGGMTRMAVRTLEQTSREYHLDPTRVYLTGLSLGGAGTWTIAAAYPTRFAAIAPVCGFGDVSDATKLAQVPVWCAHGALDQHVPVERSREMVAAIRAVGGDVTYKEFESGGHNVWDKTYNDRRFWRWLLSQRRAAGDGASAGSKGRE